MMSVQLKFFHWFSYKYSFQIVHLKVPYFSLAQRKVPKETRLFARLALKKLFKVVA